MMPVSYFLSYLLQIGFLRFSGFNAQHPSGSLSFISGRAVSVGLLRIICLVLSTLRLLMLYSIDFSHLRRRFCTLQVENDSTMPGSASVDVPSPAELIFGSLRTPRRPPEGQGIVVIVGQSMLRFLCICQQIVQKDRLLQLHS